MKYLILIIIMLIIQATNCNSSEVNNTINLSQIINLKYNYEVFEKEYPEWYLYNTNVGSGESWGESLLNALRGFSLTYSIARSIYHSNIFFSIMVRQIKIDNVDINCFTFTKRSANENEVFVNCFIIKYNNSFIIQNSIMLGSGDNQNALKYHSSNGNKINKLLHILSNAGMIIDHQGIDPRTGECFMSINFGDTSKITNLSTEKINNKFFDRQFLISEFGEAAGIINQEELTYLYNINNK